jgi:hypothetical protein
MVTPQIAIYFMDLLSMQYAYSFISVGYFTIQISTIPTNNGSLQLGLPMMASNNLIMPLTK